VALAPVHDTGLGLLLSSEPVIFNLLEYTMRQAFLWITIVSLPCRSSFAQEHWEVFVDSANFSSTVMELDQTDDAGNIYSWSTQPEAVYGVLNILEKRDSDGNFLWKVEIPESVMAFETNGAGISYIMTFTPGYTPPWALNEVLDFTLQAYDPDGAFMWSRNLNVPGFLNNDTNEQSMVVDAGGNITVAMYAYTTDPLTLVYTADTLRLMKYNGMTGETMRKRFVDISGLEMTPVHQLLADNKNNIYTYLDIYTDVNRLYKFNNFLHLQWEKPMAEYVPDKMFLFKHKTLYLADAVFSGPDTDYIEIKKINTLDGATLYSVLHPAPEWNGIGSSVHILSGLTDLAGNPYLLFDHLGFYQYHYVQKFNKSDGSIQFSNTLDDTYMHMAYTTSNHLLLLGLKDFVGSTVGISCLKFNASGDLVWEHVTTPVPGNFSVSVSVLSTNNQFIAGGYWHAGLDYARYLVSFDGDLIVRESGDFLQPEVASLYPNPAAYTITLLLPEATEILSVATYSITGEVVEIHMLDPVTADISHLPPGTYITKVLAANNSLYVIPWIKN